jgi:hypothetical protein
MGFRDAGNPPLLSTQAAGSDPTTSAILAEITGLQNRNYEVRFLVGASTGAVYVLELALSSGVSSTSFRNETRVFTASNQTSEYVLSYRAEENDRLRVRVGSSFTGAYAAKIQAEALT